MVSQSTTLRLLGKIRRLLTGLLGLLPDKNVMKKLKNFGKRNKIGNGKMCDIM